MHRVIRSIILPSSAKCFKGCQHGSPPLYTPTTVQTLRFRINNSSPQAYPRKEFNVLKIENLPVHEEADGIQPAPFPRLPTTRHIHPLLPQIVSQGNAHVPPSRKQKTPNQGFWRSEVLVLRLRIRFVRQECQNPTKTSSGLFPSFLFS